jgi:hypothetical protein
MAAGVSDLDDVISDAVTRARALGFDPASAARRAVRSARPDLTPDEAHALVEISGQRRRRTRTG